MSQFDLGTNLLKTFVKEVGSRKDAMVEGYYGALSQLYWWNFKEQSGWDSFKEGGQDVKGGGQIFIGGPLQTPPEKQKNKT